MPLIKKLIVTRAVTDLYGKIYRHFSTSVAKHMGISNWTKKRFKNVKESATSLYSLAIHSILIILTLYSLILIKLDVTNQFWFVPSLHSPWNSCFCRILIILLLVWCNWWLYCRSVFIRSSRPEVFFKKNVLRNFTKFTGKQLCQSLYFNKKQENAMCCNNRDDLLQLTFNLEISKFSEAFI